MNASWAMKHAKRLKRPVLLGLAGFCSLVMVIGGFYQNTHKNNTLKLGVSFSIKAMDGFGEKDEWKDALVAILDDIKIRNFRLMSYWDTIETSPGVYNFEKLDWQMEQIGQRGGKVTLAIGARQPRWPECHVPSWITKDNLEPAIENIIKETVKRYKDNPVLDSYQLENEFANKHFADCFGYEPARLKREFEAIRSVDKNTSITTNASNQSGTPMFGPIGDKVGFSIYKRAHAAVNGMQIPWSFWAVPPQWHSFRAEIVKLTTGKESFIHELQAEPWGPTPITEMSIEEQNKTMDSAKLKDIVDYASSTGMKTIYLWGSEWWYWRKTTLQNDDMWQTAKDLFAQAY